MNKNFGKVYLVGGGPGDLKLLTLKGKELIEKASCIVYDRLINKRILEFAKKDAELIYLGKENTDGGLLQEKINKVLVEKALSKKHEIIVRLKGGDPFVFGRGGEEIEELISNNIQFEVVPGISSSISVPTYAGIPVTHRGISKSFHVFTGMSSTDENHNFQTIAKLEGTLIFLMGIKNLNLIVSNLIQHGKSPSTPIAIIENGCTPYEKVTVGVLENIFSKSKDIKPPAITIIGDVVSKRNKFSWYENLPFFGKKIIITREINQGKEFASEIEKLGGIPILLPSIKFIDKMIHFDYSSLNKYKAIMFNSPNGVNFFFKSIPDMRVLGNIKIGAIGEKTILKLQKYKIIPDISPDEYLSDNLAFQISNITCENDDILIITSNLSNINEEEISRKYKRKFKKIIAYENIHVPIEKDIIKKELGDDTILTFFSGSAAESFFKNLNNLDFITKNIKIISLGPSTSKVIKKYINNHIIEASPYTSDGVLNIIKHNL